MATVAKAAAWNTALLGKVQSTQGTPKRPGEPLRTFLFAAFDEDLKQGGSEEAHWGVCAMDGTPKYAINLKQRYPAPPVPLTPDPVTSPTAGPGPETNSTTGSGSPTCNGTQAAGVASALSWLCAQEPGVCQTIQVGAACSTPDTLFARGTYAFHLYYQQYAGSQGAGACYFSGNAKLVGTLPGGLWHAPCQPLSPVDGKFCVATC